MFFLDLIIPFDCKCHQNKKNKASKIVHISKIYKKLQFLKNSPETENNLNYYIKQAKTIMKLIITLFFPLSNLLNFSNKYNIEEEPFFIEESLNDFKNKIQKLENNELTNDILKLIKALIFDINVFIIILKKYPSLPISEIDLFDVLSNININSRSKLIRIVKQYISDRKIVENSFDDGFKLRRNSKPINNILPIIEKKMILVLLHNSLDEYNLEFRLYNINEINNNNLLLSQNIFIFIPNNARRKSLSHITLQKINSQIILIKYNIHDIEKEIHRLNLSFLEIEYDENNKPINMQLLTEEKYLNISAIKKNIYDLDCFDENKVICTIKKDNRALVFQKNEENEFYLENEIYIDKADYFRKKYCRKNKVLVDTFNKQIIIFYEMNIHSGHYFGINFYNYDYNLKKVINYENITDNWIDKYNIILKVLDKENYIVFYGKIFIISAKYLQIITIYNIIFDFDRVFVLNNSKRIFFILKNHDDHFFIDEKPDTLVIYKFYKNRLLYVGKKNYFNNEVIDIREINEKGDHILVSKRKISFFIRKRISRIFYIKNINNENNLRIKKDYTMFKNKKEIGMYTYPINIYNKKYMHCDCDVCEDCEYCSHWYGYWNSYFNKYGWHFIYRKEDRYWNKIKYNNKKKRRYINFRDLKSNNKFRKNKRKKINFNKYELEDEDDELDNYYDEGYLI